MKNILLVWLVLTSTDQIVVPCTEWVLNKSSESFLAAACLQKTDKIVWKKQFKTRKEAENYSKDMIVLPNVTYSILEESKIEQKAKKQS